jgi:hypothetical protein
MYMTYTANKISLLDCNYELYNQKGTTVIVSVIEATLESLVLQLQANPQSLEEYFLHTGKY